VVNQILPFLTIHSLYITYAHLLWIISHIFWVLIEKNIKNSVLSVNGKQGSHDIASPNGLVRALKGAKTGFCKNVC
jgi:hypothetical protein